MFTAPLFVMSILLVVLMALATLTLVRGFDNRSMKREQELVANGMTSRVAEVGRIVTPQVIWADAVRHVDNRFDPAWAEVNILGFLQETGGFDTVFILDAEDRLLIAGEGGKIVGADRYGEFAPLVAPLVGEIRTAELVRAEAEMQATGVIKTPISSNALIAVGGETMIVTAARIQPDYHDSKLRGIHGPIVLATMRIDQSFLTEFSKRYLLERLIVGPGESPQLTVDGHTTASIPLNDPKGQTVARLHWHPNHPGLDLLEYVRPGLILMGILLFALAIRLFRRSHRMAQGLITSEARAAHLAYHDSLTGLPNRVHFGDRLAQALAARRRGGKAVTILCIDLDRFKDINDTYGHAVGDELLKEAAQRMANLCRAEDTLARLSGDEFAIVKQGASPGEAGALAARLCHEIGRPFALGSLQLHVGCSIGITSAKRLDAEPAELLREADIALYKAKEQGRGRFCFFEVELDVAIKGRRLLEAELRDALCDGQLSLAYQPQVATDGTLIGLEALLRWNHPKRGDVSPSIFVPVAEQSNLIGELGRFAIRQAFTDSKRWPDLRIAINISAQQIRDPGFICWLAQSVRELRIDPTRFDFEITEGILLGDDPETQERLSRLSRMGFGLALDDFGTGYSSLSYLNRYPIDKIKIDRSFIANLGIEAEADAVVDAIIKLARALSLGVVAEGVETESQAQMLKSAGCAELQGFLFGQPADAHAIDRLCVQRAA